MKYPFKKGQMIDGITILNDDFSFIDNRYQVKFICRCGKIDHNRLNHLLKMKYKCCKSCARKNKYPEQRKSRGHIINGIHIKWLNDIHLNLKRGQKTLKCSLSNDDLYNKLKEQDFKCIYTGIKLNVIDLFKEDSNASIDRIDSNLDYTIDNIEWVYKPINIMKNGLSKKDFIYICKLVSNFT